MEKYIEKVIADKIREVENHLKHQRKKLEKEYKQKYMKIEEESLKLEADKIKNQKRQQIEIEGQLKVIRKNIREQEGIMERLDSRLSTLNDDKTTFESNQNLIK